MVAAEPRKKLGIIRPVSYVRAKLGLGPLLVLCFGVTYLQEFQTPKARFIVREGE